MQLPNRDDIELWIAERRNALIGNLAFRRGAAKLWLTQPVARARAGQVFDLVAGFVYSQILFACVETRLMGRLAKGPAQPGELALAMNLPLPGAERLLKGAAAIGIAQRLRDGRYILGRHGAAIHGDPGIVAMIAHHRLLYADLADPVALLHKGGGGGDLAAYWAYSKGDAAPYSALMAASQAMVAEQTFSAWDFRGTKRLLDVGGGSGAFVAAVRAAHPGIETAVFDLPGVVGSGSTTIYPGDFKRDSLPGGFDTISLVRILHDHDDDVAQALLLRVAAALPVGGRVVIAEPMAGTVSARAMGDAYFGFYLWAMGSGRPRGAREICRMLEQAGFVKAVRKSGHLPLVASVVTAVVQKA